MGVFVEKNEVASRVLKAFYRIETNQNYALSVEKIVRYSRGSYWLLKGYFVFFFVVFKIFRAEEKFRLEEQVWAEYNEIYVGDMCHVLFTYAWKRPNYHPILRAEIHIF